MLELYFHTEIFNGRVDRRARSALVDCCSTPFAFLLNLVNTFFAGQHNRRISLVNLLNVSTLFSLLCRLNDTLFSVKNMIMLKLEGYNMGEPILTC